MNNEDFRPLAAIGVTIERPCYMGPVFLTTALAFEDNREVWLSATDTLMQNLWVCYTSGVLQNVKGLPQRAAMIELDIPNE